jgi:hypothetical protein
MKTCRYCRNITVRYQQSRRLQKRVQLIHQLRCLLYNLTRKLLNSTASRTESTFSLFSILYSLFSLLSSLFSLLYSHRGRTRRKRQQHSFLSVTRSAGNIPASGLRPPVSGQSQKSAFCLFARVLHPNNLSDYYFPYCGTYLCGFAQGFDSRNKINFKNIDGNLRLLIHYMKDIFLFFLNFFLLEDRQAV